MPVNVSPTPEFMKKFKNTKVDTKKYGKGKKDTKKSSKLVKAMRGLMKSKMSDNDEDD